MKYWPLICAFALSLSAVCTEAFAQEPAAAHVDVDAFVKKDKFQSIKISPTGEYFAATVPFEDRTVLAILRKSDTKVTGSMSMGKNTHVGGFWWVNPTRVLFEITEKFGALDNPSPTGEVYAMNADGSGKDLLVGWRVQGSGPGTRIQKKKEERVAAFIIDTLPKDDKNVLISVQPFVDDPYTRVDRMDVYTGRRNTVARAPIRNASFVTDHQGVVRFAQGAGTDLVSKLYYRADERSEWKLLNDESSSGRGESALGFSEDGQTAYLQVEQATGPDAIVAMDVASGQRKQVLRDDNTDPFVTLSKLGSSDVPVGALFLDGRMRSDFFDASSPEARLYRSLEAAFKGNQVYITSTTDDGKTALVYVSSDRNPGDFYLFDVEKKKADHLLARRAWFNPETLHPTEPVSFNARDGRTVHGFITLPGKSTAKNVPMVVMPHGGPFGIYDTWDFDDDSQLLASAGYAVLRVNYRGSGNHGRDFRFAGRREWGGKMQDDVTDATRWAIQQGYADPKRICIYGASYGAYAALMGVAKEPDLYRCAAGYVGVYDLPTMHTHGDIQQRGSGERYIREWIGEKASLDKVSPNRIADRIKVPVFLAAGGQDRRTPIEHSKMMEKALIAAKTPVETLYYPTEGHGFYQPEHRKEFYTRLLAFLNRSLGGATAAP